MRNASVKSSKNNPASQWQNSDYMPYSLLMCNWPMLRNQLLQQWTLITDKDLDITGPNCGRISSLIASRYGISQSMVENYLRNFERTMPLF